MSEKFIDWEEYLYVIDIVAEIINCHMYCLRPEFDKLDFVFKESYVFADILLLVKLLLS